MSNLPDDVGTVFISEYSLNLQSSGCMHFKDIYDIASSFGKTGYIHVRAKLLASPLIYKETSGWIQQVTRGTQALQNTALENIYEATIFTNPDDESHYKSDVDRTIGLEQTRYMCSLLAIKLMHFSRTTNIKFVIFVQEPVSLFLCDHLIAAGASVSIVVLDPLEMRHYFYKNAEISRGLLDNAFNRCIEEAKSVLAPSNDAVEILSSKMQRKVYPAYATYRSAAHIDINAKLTQACAEINSNKIPLSIILAGQVYAPETLAAFLQALQLTLESNYIQNARFVFVGDASGRTAVASIAESLRIPDVQVITKKTMSYSELQEEFKMHHFGYVPFPFISSLKETVAFSFPSKFVSYVEAGLLPIYHGPSVSTVNNVLNRFSFNYLTVNGFAVDEIGLSLKNIISTFTANFSINQYHNLHQFFLKRNLSDSIHKFLS